MTSPNIVTGAVSTVTELGKDEAWLQGWLKEQPTRLGLGDVSVADGEPVQDDEGNPAFLATDEERYFSVDVRLGELDASRGFQVLDNWARNRVRHPDKTHVAVLVTETAGERYRTTLEALTEHLPLVVVELQVWRGDTEAILVPHVALSSDDVDLSSTPAVKAADALAQSQPEAAATVDASTEGEPQSDTAAEGEPEPVATGAGADTDTTEDSTPEDKDDTGVADPWGLPQEEPEAATGDDNSSNGKRLLDTVGS